MAVIKNSKLLGLFCLLIILTVASFFRLWQLDLIPPGLYPDVAIYGNDALNSLKTGDFKVFYPDNFGREGLFMWLLALSFSIFGVSIWSLKIVAAIIGILTVLGLYLLTKELFSSLTMKQLNPEGPRPFSEKGEVYEVSNSIIIALLSSFFLAISFWHINFSRLGFRAILFPFILVFAFYFLFKGFRERKVWNIILAGLFFGLGFYTYISYRFIILLLPLILICWFFIYRKENLTKNFFRLTGYLLLVTIIVALPIGIYFLQNPQDFVGRAAPVSVFAAENPIKEFGKSLILHLGMFNFYGDPNWRHNFAGSPMLLWLIGILFLIGIFLSVKELVNFQKHKNLSLVISHLSLVIWLFVMLLPGILTYEGIPHALRTIGVIPVVYIFAGLGGWWSYEQLKKIIKNRKLLISLCLLFLISLIWAEYCKYFLIWAQRPEVEDAFTKRYADIGYYLNSLPPEIQKYVIVNEFGTPLYGISISAQTPIFIEATKFGQPQSIYLRAEELDQIKINGRKTVIVPLYNGKLRDELQRRFPQGEIEEKNKFWIYKID